MTAVVRHFWRDRERLRDLVIDANDGIVAIAGVVEGVLAAGLGNRAAATAVLMTTVAGGIALGGSRTPSWPQSETRVLDCSRRSSVRSSDRRIRSSTS
jgi:hypothetical protein